MEIQLAKVTKQNLDDWFCDPDIDFADKLLVCLACHGGMSTSYTQIQLLFSDHGMSHVMGMAEAIPRGMERLGALVHSKNLSYKLTTKGKQEANRVIAKLTNTPIATAVTHLSDVLPQIRSDKVRSFVEEAINDIKFEAFRSTVVLSWVGAVGLLQEYVFANNLDRFNTEARRVKQNWRDATKEDDLRKMQESDFLVVICNMGLIEKNERQELEKCLTLRNGCGHPSGVVPGKAKIEAHIEDLVKYVFAKFG